MQCKYASTVKFTHLPSGIIMHLIFCIFSNVSTDTLSLKHLYKKQTNKQTANHRSSTAGICVRTSRVKKPCFYSQNTKKRFKIMLATDKEKLQNATPVMHRNVSCILQLFLHGTHGQRGSFTS